MTDATQDTASVPTTTVERLSNDDKNRLGLSIANRKIALANAEKTLAQHENAELSYKYLVVQLFMKYGLNENDNITENGDIVRAEPAATETKE